MNSSQNKLSFYHVLNRTKIEQLMAVVVVIFPQLEICGNSFIIFSYLLLIMWKSEQNIDLTGLKKI